MKRSVPVILTATFLGLLAAFQLLGAGGMVVTGVLSLHNGLPATTPSPFAPSFLPIFFFGLSLIAVALAVWSIVTLIGLVRLRSWARYSLLVIAGLMTVIAGIGALTSFAMPFLGSVAGAPPTVDPSVMRGIFFATGAVYAVVTAIGIALLVYFNLARTRELFLVGAPVSLTPPNTSTGRPRPTAITVIAWLYLVTAPFCLIYMFLPIPGFLFGFICSGMAAHLLYAAFGAVTFVLGYGLYRLCNWARLAVFAWFGVGVINLLVLVTPWGRGRFHTYMDAANAHMFAYGNMPPPQQNFAASPAVVGFGACLGFAFCAVILWLLHRYRVAFTPAMPPPPMPPAAGVQAE